MNTYHCFLKFSSENRNCFLHVVKILLEKAVIGWPADIIKFHPKLEVKGSNKEHRGKKGMSLRDRCLLLSLAEKDLTNGSNCSGKQRPG